MEELMPQIRQAYADDLVDEFYINLPWVEEVLERGKPAALARLHKDHPYHFVNDSVAYLARMPWWDEVQPTPSFVPASPGRSRDATIPAPVAAAKNTNTAVADPSHEPSTLLSRLRRLKN